MIQESRRKGRGTKAEEGEEVYRDIQTCVPIPSAQGDVELYQGGHAASFVWRAGRRDKLR